jgi:hypothetical protein
MLNGEVQGAEEEDEIVKLKILKGGCDVFFYSHYSSLAKADRGDAAGSLKGRGTGVGITQLRDSALQWMRDHETLVWVGQNRTGSSRAAAATPARI